MIRKYAPPAEPAVHWSETFCGLAIVLLCFFIVIYAMSERGSLNTGRQRSGEAGVLSDEQFNAPPVEPFVQTESGDWNYGSVKYAAHEAFTALVADARGFLGAAEIPAEVLVDYDAYMVTIRFADASLFETEQNAIRESAGSAISSLAALLDGAERNIAAVTIESHTDTRTPEAWETTALRAAVFTRQLLEMEINNDLRTKISSAGYGGERPVDSSGITAGDAKNRRIDIVIRAFTPEGRLHTTGNATFSGERG